MASRVGKDILLLSYIHLDKKNKVSTRKQYNTVIKYL